MPKFPPSVPGNQRFLQRQINQINTSRPGPMSWGPDDGHIRFYAADGRVLFQVDSTGASVEFRGALTGLTPRLEQQDTFMTNERTERLAVQAQVQGQIADERETRMAVDSQLSGQIASERTDRIAVDTSLSGQIASEKATRMEVDSQLSGQISTERSARQDADSGLSSRITTAQSTASGAASAAASARDRADEAYSRAGTGITSAAEAKQDAANAMARAARIIKFINQVGSSARISSGGMSIAAEPSDWQQLKNCLAS